MNERIKELAEQSHSYACEYAQRPDYNPHNPYNQGMYKQRYDSKFAELIVRECAELIDNKEMITTQQTYDEVFVAKYDTKEQCSKQILEHFGVEQ